MYKMNRSALVFLLVLGLSGLTMKVSALPIKKCDPTLPAKNIIVDTDMGWDDWLALEVIASFIQSSVGPCVNLLGISVTGNGEAHLENGVENVLKLLSLYGMEGVEVLPGSSRPLSPYLHPFPDYVRTPVDHLDYQQIPPSSQTPIKTDLPVAKALAKYYQQWINSVSGSVTFLLIGGYSNFALALEDAEFKSLLNGRVDKVLAMSGALNVPGNIHEVDSHSRNLSAEWNIFIDPVAAERVLEEDIPLTMVPLDFTNQLKVDKDTIEDMQTALANNGCRPAMKFAENIVERSFKEGYGTYFFDPAVAFIMLDGSTVKPVVRADIQIVIDDSEQSGRIVKSNKGTKVDFILEPKSQKQFIHSMIQRMATVGQPGDCYPGIYGIL